MTEDEMRKVADAAWLHEMFHGPAADAAALPAWARPVITPPAPIDPTTAP